MLKLENISKYYGSTQVLSDINLSISPGQIVALLAPNGAGKTTLIEIIAGLIKADQGFIKIKGQQAKAPKYPQNSRHLIGMAGQDIGIYPTLSVLENIEFFAALYAIPKAVRQQSIKDILALLDLSTLSDKKAAWLSGGEKRRLHTACAMVHRPKLLLLDEPTVGADPKARSAILQTVKGCANRGTAVLYTSHYLAEITELEADVVIMNKGNIIDSGQQQRLIKKYGKAQIQVEFNQPIAAEVQSLFEQSHCVKPNQLDIVCCPKTDSISSVLKQLQGYNNNLIHIEHHTASLEQVFFNLLDRAQHTD